MQINILEHFCVFLSARVPLKNEEISTFCTQMHEIEQQLTTPSRSYSLGHTNSYLWYEHHPEGNAMMTVRSDAKNESNGDSLTWNGSCL